MGKRILYIFVSFAAIIGLFYSCDQAAISKLPTSVTMGADNVSAISVVLMGKVNLSASASADLKVGFQYSTSSGILPSNSTTIEATDADAAYNYTAVVTGLEPATKYYFRSFVRQNGQDFFGETKEFTTKDVASLIETKDATDIQNATAKLNAKLDLTDAVAKDVEYGFYWGTMENELNNFIVGEDSSDNSYYALLTVTYKTQYWYKAFAKIDDHIYYGEVKTLTTESLPNGAVDLGIVMRRKDGSTYNLYWATSNLCISGLCTNPEDFGDYYAWGELEPHYLPGHAYDEKWEHYKNGYELGYDYKCYKWFKIIDDNLLVTKYCPSEDAKKWGGEGKVDDKRILDSIDDAAHMILGNKWRIPTREEWEALRTNCSSKWTIQNGVYGRLITGKNNNSIFLPAAGVRYQNDFSGMGTDGAYWSSSLYLYTDYSRAESLYFRSDRFGESTTGYRYDGLSIRPVIE